MSGNGKPDDPDVASRVKTWFKNLNWRLALFYSILSLLMLFVVVPWLIGITIKIGQMLPQNSLTMMVIAGGAFGLGLVVMGFIGHRYAHPKSPSTSSDPGANAVESSTPSQEKTNVNNPAILNTYERLNNKSKKLQNPKEPSINSEYSKKRKRKKN